MASPGLAALAEYALGKTNGRSKGFVCQRVPAIGNFYFSEAAMLLEGLNRAWPGCTNHLDAHVTSSDWSGPSSMGRWCHSM
jgi:hypothetical protein